MPAPTTVFDAAQRAACDPRARRTPRRLPSVRATPRLQQGGLEDLSGPTGRRPNHPTSARTGKAQGHPAEPLAGLRLAVGLAKHRPLLPRLGRSAKLQPPGEPRLLGPGLSGAADRAHS